FLQRITRGKDTVVARGGRDLRIVEQYPGRHRLVCIRHRAGWIIPVTPCRAMRPPLLVKRVGTGNGVALRPSFDQGRKFLARAGHSGILHELSSLPGDFWRRLPATWIIVFINYFFCKQFSTCPVVARPVNSGQIRCEAEEALREAELAARKTEKRQAAKPSDVPGAALRFLEHYYPIHYKAGIGVEDALRGGVLNRHQVAMLWLIHSEGKDGREMDRKAIERSLESWFEISSAAITKALRAMAQPPLALIRLVE